MDKRFTIADYLTLFRVALIPVVAILFFIPTLMAHILAAVFFIIAGITDWVDGYVARKLNIGSRFGAFLDPVADKMLVAAVLVLMCTEFRSFLITLPAIVIILREIVVSALREWMAELGKREVIKVSFIAKVKTNVQIYALAGLLIYQPNVPHMSAIFVISVILLYAAMGLTLWSMWQYWQLAWKDLAPKQNTDLTL